MARILGETEARALIEGLDQAEFKKVVSRAIGGNPILGYEPAFEKKIGGCQGYGALKCIVTVKYSAVNGSSGQVDLLIKYYQGWNRPAESHIYGWLESRRSPVPQLWGTFFTKANEEVLLIECLPHIGYDEKKPDEFARYLVALAQFNAMETSAKTEAAPPLPQQSFEKMSPRLIEWLNNVLDCGARGEIGPEIQATCAAAADLRSSASAWIAALAETGRSPRLAASSTGIVPARTPRLAGGSFGPVVLRPDPDRFGMRLS